jgi:hypothetical protein
MGIRNFNSIAKKIYIIFLGIKNIGEELVPRPKLLLCFAFIHDSYVNIRHSEYRPRCHTLYLLTLPTVWPRD